VRCAPSFSPTIRLGDPTAVGLSLLGLYRNREPDILTVTPLKSARENGHFGLLPPRPRDTLCAGAAEWLAAET